MGGITPTIPPLHPLFAPDPTDPHGARQRLSLILRGEMTRLGITPAVLVHLAGVKTYVVSDALRGTLDADSPLWRLIGHGLQLAGKKKGAG